MEAFPIPRFTTPPRPIYVEENPWVLSQDHHVRRTGSIEYYSKEVLPNINVNGDLKLNFRVEVYR